MLYEIRVRPNCDPESCHVLRSTFSFPSTILLSPSLSHSAVLIGHLLPLWQTEVQRKAQATCAGKNECHSFIYSFIHSFTQSRIRPHRIPVHFAHAIKPGIGLDSPQLHSIFSSSLSLSLALPSLPRFTCANRSS